MDFYSLPQILISPSMEKLNSPIDGISLSEHQVLKVSIQVLKPDDIVDANVTLNELHVFLFITSENKQINFFQCHIHVEF